MFKIITSTSIIASQSSLEKRREVTLMMLPDGLLSRRQRRSRRLCRQECHLHNHQRQSHQPNCQRFLQNFVAIIQNNTKHLHNHQRQSRQKKKFPSLSSGGLFVISKRAILFVLLIKPKYYDRST